MRTITTQTQDAWLSGDYVGANRPIARVTVQHPHLLKVPVGVKERYSSWMWGQTSKPIEIPNVKSVHWERGSEGDGASCTLTLYNTDPLPLGTAADRDDEFGLPGAYTFNHGVDTWAQGRWGHQPNGWQDRLVPDRIIRTYQGYGFDVTVAPEVDPHMYITGVWKIDDVEYTHDGLITVTCRDASHLLLDQILFPPVVPFKKYPLSFTLDHSVANPKDVVVTGGSSKWTTPTYQTDSGVPYNGKNGTIAGHHGTDAFDDSDSTYWLSIGNDDPDAGYSFEYIQGKFKASTLNAVKFHVWGGPYRVYVSVKTSDGNWKGRQVVPYDPDNPVSSPNGADINYVASMRADHNDTVTWKPKNPIDDVVAVRIAFTNLYNSGIGPYVYRAGMRNIQVNIGTASSSSEVDAGSHTEGDYSDYSDIVKKLLAYAGFYWPNDARLATQRYSDGTTVTTLPAGDDPLLGKGDVWGDIELAGTGGDAGTKLTPDVWDKKPVMDGINYIADIISHQFFIDETGAAIFRSPNIWSLGNWKDGARVSDVVEIDDTTVLIGLRAKLSSRSIREQIFVSTVSGGRHVGAAVKGHNPYPTGLRRVGGWTDTHFNSTKDCRIMADLIALRQLFTYRTDTLTIAANPAIQIDDQVQIYERVTNEGYVHYVGSMSSDWDVETGKWTYDLQTHWLGSSPDTVWAFKSADLSDDTQQFLRATGKIG